MKHLAISLLFLLSACGASPAYEPEVPPPPPHDLLDAIPLEPATQGVLVVDGDAGAPVEPPKVSGLPELPSSAPIYAPDDPAPPAGDRTVTYSNGQWVNADGYGWMWVPNGSSTVVVEQVPYSYFYTPSYGWNWYVSPWGPGAYRYGGWVRRPYRPYGYRGGWVASPHVHARIGPTYRSRPYRQAAPPARVRAAPAPRRR